MGPQDPGRRVDGVVYRPIEAHGICRRCGWLVERREGEVSFYRSDSGQLCVDNELHVLS